jgi:hypothetical protein
MSRGLGRAERAVLAYLTEQARRHPEHATRLGVIASLTELHPESVRRAMKTLAAKGKLELGWDNGWRVLDSEGPFRMWDTAAPTARLSAEQLSALSGRQA